VIDPDAVVIARLVDERLADAERIKILREQVAALTAAVRAQQRELCAMTSLAELLLSSDRMSGAVLSCLQVCHHMRRHQAGVLCMSRIER